MRFELRICPIAICLFLSVGPSGLAQDSPPKDGRYYESIARKAYKEKDYAAFLENMKRAAELRPNHPRLMYNLAAAFALNKQPSEALAWLRQTAEMGLVFAASTDTDLDSLKSLSEFQTIINRFEQNRAPKISSEHAFTVREKGLIPESVAYDATTKVFYLSSVYKRKILRVTRKGDVTVFANESDGLWSVMGMKVDRARRLLWVCTTAHPQMINYRSDENGQSALMKYNLVTGELIKKYVPADRTNPHWLGDLTINSEGDVFATDSLTPAVYLVRHDKNEMETFLEGRPFTSPQGLDFSRDEKNLFVADYSNGIFIVETSTRTVTSLASNFTLLGIDGLYTHKGTLVCVQNGVNPQRLIRLFLKKDLSRVERFQTIEANNPVFDEPTLGVLVKDDFYFVANSQWGAVNRTGHLAPEEKLREPMVLRVRL